MNSIYKRWSLVLLVWLVLCPFVILSAAQSTHYDTLGIKKDATESEIKKAYRTLALKWHPDKAAEKDREHATKEFQKISEAYEVLSDKEQRRQYDQMNTANDNNGGWTATPGNNGRGTPNRGHSQGQQFSFNHRSPEEIFKEFFGTDNPFGDMEKMFGGATTPNKMGANKMGGGATATMGGLDGFASMFGGDPFGAMGGVFGGNNGEGNVKFSTTTSSNRKSSTSGSKRTGRTTKSSSRGSKTDKKSSTSKTKRTSSTRKSKSSSKPSNKASSAPKDKKPTSRSSTRTSTRRRK